MVQKMQLLGVQLVGLTTPDEWRIYTIVGGSTQLKNIRQNGNLPQMGGVNIKKIFETATWYMTKQYKNIKTLSSTSLLCFHSGQPGQRAVAACQHVALGQLISIPIGTRVTSTNKKCKVSVE